MELGDLYSKLLSELTLARAYCQNIHWNYTGDNFIEIHKYMDDNKAMIDWCIDSIAEEMKIQNYYVRNQLLNINIADINVTDDTLFVIQTYVDTLHNIIDIININGYGIPRSTDMIFDDIVAELGKITWFISSSFPQNQSL